MSGPDHGGDPLLPNETINGIWCEWTDPPPLGETQHRLDRLTVGVLACCLAIALFDASEAQLLGQPSLAIAARCDCTGLGQRISGIVDITELGEALGDCLQVRLGIAFPAPLPKLAREISTELGAGRRVLADIAQRQFPEGLVVEGRRRPLAFEVCTHA